MSGLASMAFPAMKAQGVVTQRQGSSMRTPNPRSSSMAWIGAWSGLFGVVVYSLVQPDEMLPINRLLFGIDSTLMLIWLLVILYDRPGGQP